jgi:hypothetical protein
VEHDAYTKLKLDENKKVLKKIEIHHNFVSFYVKNSGIIIGQSPANYFMLILIFLFQSTGTIRTKLSKKVPLPSLFSSSEIHHRKERSQDDKKGVFSDFVCGAFIFLRSQKVPSWL